MNVMAPTLTRCVAVQYPTPPLGGVSMFMNCLRVPPQLHKHCPRNEGDKVVLTDYSGDNGPEVFVKLRPRVTFDLHILYVKAIRLSHLADIRSCP